MSAFRPRTGFISGVLAILAAYILIAIVSLFLSTQAESLSGIALHHALFYHAHNPLAAVAAGTDPFGLSGSLLWVVVLLIPPLILSSQAHELAASDATPVTAIQQSSSVAFGYTPLALAGLVVLVGDIQVIDAVLTAIIYPVGFGIVGGLIQIGW